MARKTHQNAPLRRAPDDSSATLALSYTGGVTAQSAVDYTADLDELTTTGLDMQSEKTPRSVPSGYPSRNRIPTHLVTAFPGDSSFPSSANYVLAADSYPGSQNSSTEHRHSIDLSSDPSRSSLHFRQEQPWNSFDATQDFSLSGSSKAGPPATLDRSTNPYVNFQTSGFHDSALGTLTHDESQSLMTSSLAGMDDSYQFGYPVHSQPQEVLPKEDSGETESHADANGDGDDENQPPPRSKTQRQLRTREELTCDMCHTVSTTPSNHKKHKARHEVPYKCTVTDCPRAVKGFATRNDLDRHGKSLHGENARNSKSYKCFAPNCPRAVKNWPRLDNFKQHCVRMHEEVPVDELVRLSNDWWEEQHTNASAQSTAAADVLHSQEAAARESSQKGKRRRNSSPPADEPFPKQPALGPLRTRGLQGPPQDHTRLSPSSAQSSFQDPQLIRPPRDQPTFFNPPNVRFAADRWQRAPYHRTGRRQVPVSGRSAAEPVQSIISFQELSSTQLPFDTDEFLNFDMHHDASQSAVDQQSQFPYNSAHNVAYQRPHTAPDINSDYSQIRIAFLDETRPVPPGQEGVDDFEHDTTGWGTGSGVQRCTPETSNGPTTPLQPAPVPHVVVLDEPDHPEGPVKDKEDMAVEGLRSWLRRYDRDGKALRRLLATQDFDSTSESPDNKSILGSVSDVGVSRKSTAGSSVSRASKGGHVCSTCEKRCPRLSELKKHEKRHSRPYGCVLDHCYKRFGSKNDLKRHESTHLEQKECYRCDGGHHGPNGDFCHKVWYNGRESFKRHLRECASTDPNYIEQTANECRIPAANEGRFWCGFCVGIIDHMMTGVDASAASRLSHIDSHFNHGKRASDWVELGGDGETKAQVERRQNIAKNQKTEVRDRGSQHEGQRGSSSASSDSQLHVPELSSMQSQQGQMLERQFSSASQYGHRTSSQQLYPGEQMQRARSQGQPAESSGTVPTRRYKAHGQAPATEAECCQCQMLYLLQLGRKCANCDHPLCTRCKKK